MEVLFKWRNVYINFFITIYVIDLFLFGGGRVVEFYGITLRMVLFSFALILSLICLIESKSISSNVAVFLLTFIVVLSYSSFVSVLDSNFNLNSVIAFSFVFIALFFTYYHDRFLKILIKLISFSSFFMASIYLLFLFLVVNGKFSIFDVYKFIPKSELFFRGEDGFVYKGFIYVMVGALYFVIVKNQSIHVRYIGFFVCLVATIATLTRGFVLSLVFVVFLFYLFKLKSIALKYTIFIIFLSMIISFSILHPELFLREGSDSTRINDIFAFISFLNGGGIDVLLGKGVSAYLGDRQSVENAYMDTWIRFGFLGVLLLLISFIKLTLDYRYIIKINLKSNVTNNSYYDWLYYSVLLIFIQSNFNPYINNYIGGTFFVFTLVHFDSIRNRLKLHHG